jgi:lipopolysaccharide exporter
LRHVSIVMSGTFFAQLVTLLTAPLLSRLFSPSDFGIFAFYTSIISVLSVIITLRYELAIVIPNKEKDSISLLFLSVFISIINSILVFMVLFSTKNIIMKYAGVGEFKDFYYYIPIILLFLGIFNSLKYWNIKKENFKRTSNSDITNSFATNTTQLTLGLLNTSFFGLIIGKLLGQFAATIIMLFQVLKEDLKKFKNNFSLVRIKNNLTEYKDFPVYGMPQALFSSLSMNMVPILLLIFFSSTMVGYYALALRVLQMPINLIGNAFKDVFYQRSALLINQNGNLKRLYFKSIISLALLFSPLVLIIYFFSNEIFGIVFGEEWYLTGEITKWMILWMYSIIISRPAIVLMQVLKRQKIYLNLEVMGFIVKTALFTLVSVTMGNYIISIAIYSISNMVHYLMIMVLVNKYINEYEVY